MTKKRSATIRWRIAETFSRFCMAVPFGAHMNLEALSQLNPDHFTLDEAMASFGLYRWSAKFIMSAAVRSGKLRRLDDGAYALPPAAPTGDVR